MSYASQVSEIFSELGIALPGPSPRGLEVRSPIDGKRIAAVPVATPARTDGRGRTGAVALSCLAQRAGAATRCAGEGLGREGSPAQAGAGAPGHHRDRQDPQEGLGEVQEAIDICEFALGLSRQLYGLSIATERPDHKLLETWHPLGVVGIISAFNFPMAVWAWNASLALVCGNTLVWKPSEKTPLSALAINGLLLAAARETGVDPEGLSAVVIGERDLGEALVAHPNVRLVSATGSTGMGRAVGVACAKHFKRSLLELGGNNAAIVCPSADLKLAARAVTFAAVGTAGQRCTSLRRLIVHRSIVSKFVKQLRAAYAGPADRQSARRGHADRAADRCGRL